MERSLVGLGQIEAVVNQVICRMQADADKPIGLGHSGGYWRVKER